MKTINNKFDFSSFIPAFKAEWLKNNHVSLGLLALLLALGSILTITIASEMVNANFASMTVNSEKVPFVKSYAEIVFLYVFTFILVSYPLINAILASRSYKLEFSNNTKRSLYTQTIPRSTIFFAKLAFALCYDFLALLFLFIYILAFSGRYIRLYEPNLVFTFSHVYNLFLSGIAIIIATIPLLSLHIWLSSRKFPQLWNSSLLIGAFLISLYIFAQPYPNEWYNFEFYPFIMLLNTKGANVFSGPWAWFSQNSLWFVLTMSMVYSATFLFLISKYIKRSDAKF